MLVEEKKGEIAAAIPKPIDKSITFAVQRTRASPIVAANDSISTATVTPQPSTAHRVEVSVSSTLMNI